MNIIKEGKPKALKCKRCNTKFEYDKSDIIRTMAERVDCPICGKRYYLKASDRIIFSIIG